MTNKDPVVELTLERLNQLKSVDKENVIGIDYKSFFSPDSKVEFFELDLKTNMISFSIELNGKKLLRNFPTFILDADEKVFKEEVQNYILSLK